MPGHAPRPLRPEPPAGPQRRGRMAWLGLRVGPGEAILARVGLEVRRAGQGGDDPFAAQLALIGGEAGTIIDGGAASGLTAKRPYGHFPRARVHAFEPGPEAFARLAARALPR